MYNKIHKAYEEQVEIFRERGMAINNKDIAIKKLENIGYYRIKEFAEPYFSSNPNGEKKYEKISFEVVVSRFYKDKNLRGYLLDAIEKVELSFKTKFAYLLGKKGAFSYLKFNHWCNKNEYCKHFIKLKEESFKKHLKILINKNKHKGISDFFSENKGEEFPPIWLVIDIMSFGDILNIFELMSKNNKRTIASWYNCTDTELESWLNHLKFIRNKCAHNCNIIDLKIITLPKIRSEWKEYLFYKTPDANPSKIAVTFVVLYYLVNQINKDYGFGLINKALSGLIRGSDASANHLGFSNRNSSNSLFFKKV